MAKHSYVIYQIRAHVRNRKSAIRPLHDIDGKGADLFALIKDQIKKSEGVVEEDDSVERAHRIESSRRSERSIVIEAKAGPYGLTGTSVDLDSGDERDYTDRTANMSPLRSMFLIPREGYDGLVFCERVGVSNFRGPIDKTILRPIASDFGLTIKTQAHVDAKAWSQYLDNAHVRKITAVYRSNRREDLGSRRGREQDLKIIAGGPVATRIGRDLGRTILSSLTTQGAPIAYNIDDYPDLRPSNRGYYEQERLELQVDDGSSTRLIVVERAELPQFTYVLGGRPSTRTLHQAWAEHGRQLLSDMDANIVL